MTEVPPIPVGELSEGSSLPKRRMLIAKSTNINEGLRTGRQFTVGVVTDQGPPARGARTEDRPEAARP